MRFCLEFHSRRPQGNIADMAEGGQNLEARVQVGV